MQQLTVPRRWLSRASQPINLTIAAAAPLPTVKLINVADGDPVALLGRRHGRQVRTLPISFSGVFE